MLRFDYSAAIFDKSWLLPMMRESTRDLLSAVVSCELL